MQIWIGAAALAVIGASLGLLAQFRVRESKEFQQLHTVQTYGGTNYAVRVNEVTIGRTDGADVVIVSLRLENPNSFEVVLKRDWFVLVDHDKDYYQPTVGASQQELIKLPPNGVREKELLTFRVLEESFDGTLALQVGRNYYALLKEAGPYKGKLSEGEFRSFRRRDW